MHLYFVGETQKEAKKECCIEVIKYLWEFDYRATENKPVIQPNVNHCETNLNPVGLTRSSQRELNFVKSPPTVNNHLFSILYL